LGQKFKVQTSAALIALSAQIFDQIGDKLDLLQKNSADFTAQEKRNLAILINTRNCIRSNRMSRKFRNNAILHLKNGRKMIRDNWYKTFNQKATYNDKDTITVKGFNLFEPIDAENEQKLLKIKNSEEHGKFVRLFCDMNFVAGKLHGLKTRAYDYLDKLGMKIKEMPDVEAPKDNEEEDDEEESEKKLQDKFSDRSENDSDSNLKSNFEEKVPTIGISKSDQKMVEVEEIVEVVEKVTLTKEQLLMNIAKRNLGYDETVLNLNLLMNELRKEDNPHFPKVFTGNEIKQSNKKTRPIVKPREMVKKDELFHGKGGSSDLNICLNQYFNLHR
jgi:hypothetical protein